MILAAFPNLNDSVIPSTFLGGCTMKTSIQGRFPVLKAFITSMAVGAELPLPSNHCCPGRLRTYPPLLQAELPTPIRMDKGGGAFGAPRAGLRAGMAVELSSQQLQCSLSPLLFRHWQFSESRWIISNFLLGSSARVRLHGAGSARSRDALDVAPGVADCFPLQIKGVKTITAFFSSLEYWHLIANRLVSFPTLFSGFFFQVLT